MPHLLTEAAIIAWPEFTAERPLRVLVSGCLVGRRCGVDGSTNGEYPVVATLLALPNVRVVDFCPEDFAFGTPRATPNIYGGDGFDVLPESRHRRPCDGLASRQRREPLDAVLDVRSDVVEQMLVALGGVAGGLGDEAGLSLRCVP